LLGIFSWQFVWHFVHRCFSYFYYVFSLKECEAFVFPFLHLWIHSLKLLIALDDDNCMEKTKTLKLLGDWLFAEISLNCSKCWCKTLQRKRTEMLTMLLLPGVDNNEFWSKKISVAHFTKRRCKFSHSHHLFLLIPNICSTGIHTCVSLLWANDKQTHMISESDCWLAKLRKCNIQWWLFLVGCFFCVIKAQKWN
jgi:hypothetical protein